MLSANPSFVILFCHEGNVFFYSCPCVLRTSEFDDDNNNNKVCAICMVFLYFYYCFLVCICFVIGGHVQIG